MAVPVSASQGWVDVRQCEKMAERHMNLILRGGDMSRADLIVSLVKAGSQGDQQLLRTTVEAMAAEERAKHHHQLADKLEENLRAVNGRSRTTEVVRSFDGGHGGLLYEVVAAGALSKRCSWMPRRSRHAANWWKSSIARTSFAPMV